MGAWGVGAAMAVVLLGTSAEAQSPICRQLQADYARLQARLEASDPTGDALARQQAALARAQSDHDRMCGLSLFSRPAAVCPDLARRIVEMQTSLQRLQARGGGRGPNPALMQEKARLSATLAANGCGTSGGGYAVQGPDGPILYREGPNGTMIRVGPAPRVAERPQPQPQGGGFLGALFGGFTQPQPQRPPQPPPGLGGSLYEEMLPEDEGRGAYRTLCVRTCDGYYFPISFSTSSSRFPVDADVCRARCPAAETRLFVHPTEAESESAVAADNPDQSYSSLPNALKYRTQVVQGCTCGQPDPSLLPQEAEETSRRRNAFSETMERGAVPLPMAKPARDLDPDQAWNLASGFIPEIGVLPQPPADGAEALRPNDRKVRVVGPKFFVAR